MKKINLTNTKIIVDGNSLTVWGSVLLADKLTNLLPGVTSTNFGVSGQTTAQMLLDQQSQVISSFDPVKTNVLVVLELGNHLNTGVTPEVAHNAYREYCLNARAAGAYVVACTAFDRRNSNGTEETLRPKILVANALVRSFWPSYANTLVDAPSALSAVFANAENRGWWPDGVHYSPVTYDRFAALVAKAIGELLIK